MGWCRGAGKLLDSKLVLHPAHDGATCEIDLKSRCWGAHTKGERYNVTGHPPLSAVHLQQIILSATNISKLSIEYKNVQRKKKTITIRGAGFTVPDLKGKIHIIENSIHILLTATETMRLLPMCSMISDVAPAKSPGKIVVILLLCTPSGTSTKHMFICVV